jgi:glutathione S-transferase
MPWMRLYHSPRTRSNRVLWALEEIGVPYDVTTLTLEERRGPEHRRRHPLGRVPVLELDDGRMLIESAAICLHLGDAHPEAGLVPPAGSPGRGLVYQWTVFAMTELEPTVIAWVAARRDGADEVDLPERFAERAAVLDAALRDRAWLVGDRFSVADIVCVKVLNIAFSRELVDGPPALRDYVDRGQARPAHVRAEAVGA